MPTISFDQAQQALGHLRNNNQQGPKPPLLSVKGWSKSKIVYGLKRDIEIAFDKEIDRFKDLLQERQQLQQAFQKEDVSDSCREELKEQGKEINDEINELLQEEKEIEISIGKLTEQEFGDVIDSELMIDLDFAIELEPLAQADQSETDKSA